MWGEGGDSGEEVIPIGSVYISKLNQKNVPIPEFLGLIPIDVSRYKLANPFPIKFD